MPSKSYRNNNPGNIRFGQFTQGYGAIDDNTGFAKFPTVIQGLAAMLDLLAGPRFRDLSIRAALHKYAPKSENDTEKYIAFICRETLRPNFILRDLDPFQILGLLRSMIRFEGWKP